jgi:KUP system potassium uptake protein
LHLAIVGGGLGRMIFAADFVNIGRHRRRFQAHAVYRALMIVTIALTIIFRKSDNLASAYGIAVLATMLMTSFLLFIAMHEYLRWSLAWSAAVSLVFIFVDGAFFAANLAKIAEGGYVPLTLAALIYGVMWIWHTGRRAVTHAIIAKYVPLDAYLARLAEEGVPRVPGTAVFMTRSMSGAPPVMARHVKHNRALHQRIMVVNITIESVPYVRPEDRLAFTEEAPGVWRALAHYGFMERPDVPALLQESKARSCEIAVDDATYYVGREMVMSRPDGHGLPKWVEAIFAVMDRSTAQVTDFFNLPVDQVVEIGRQVAI